MDFLDKYTTLLQVYFLFLLISFFFLKKDFISILERERERAQVEEGEAEREGEADFPLSREPDVGLNPRTLS